MYVVYVIMELYIVIEYGVDEFVVIGFDYWDFFYVVLFCGI